MVADSRSTLRLFSVFLPPHTALLLFFCCCSLSVVIGGAPHGRPDLPDPGPAGSHPGAQGAGLVQFAEEGGAAAEAVELFG
jgi:hypothetical protein